MSEPRRIALVTGAAQGIGLATARRLASDGATVVAADLDEELLRAATAELRADGLRVEACRLDVGDSASVLSAFGQVADEHGGAEILVNCAGVSQRVASAVELEESEWARVLQVNLTGTFLCCRAAGAQMARSERGCIVNIASINGTQAAPLTAAYSASKAGVLSLTQTLAIELAAFGVRVNAVCPGPIYTALNQSVVSGRAATLKLTEAQMRERIRAAIPLGRWGEPDDIANTVSFLCSDAASWITGEVITVSGGLGAVPATPARHEIVHDQE